jgi:hypothetical protein
MKINLKDIEIYLISPGENKYRDRALTVLTRLIDEGYKKITYFKSLPGSNNTVSLTNTVVEIFKREMSNDQPFIIIEDDCGIFNKYDTIEIPDNLDILYLGVSNWVYPHVMETLSNRHRPNIFPNSANTIRSYNDMFTKINGMCGTHAILYNSREFMRVFINKMNEISSTIPDLPHDLLFAVLQNQFNAYAFKQPMFFQDSTLGGQENVTKLLFNGECYR